MLIDGNKIAEMLENKLKTELLFLSPKKVCFVVFGGNIVTEQFVKNKSVVALRAGIAVDVKSYPDIRTTNKAIETVVALGKQDYDGIVVQLPLPKNMDAQAVLDAVPPLNDIDVLSSVARMSYSKGTSNKTPPVAQAVLHILEANDVSLSDKEIVIVGAGRLVGKPLQLMFTKMNLPYHTIDISTPAEEKFKLLKNADVVISGTGRPHSIKPNMLKSGVILIDAGTSEQEGKVAGDIDPECSHVASLMTPVPGGVGPVTIVSLLGNLL